MQFYESVSMKAVIVGGGIGGLCAALCLDHFGWQVEVLEQAEKLSEVGAGIQVSPNGVKVLRALGVESLLKQHAFAPKEAQFRIGASGTLIGRTRWGTAMERRHGAPYWHVHRADLVEVLAGILETRSPGALRTGAAVTGYGQDEGSGWAILADGSRAQGDIVIGADGIKSVIRQQMLGPSNPRFTGNVAWRAVVPMDRLDEHVPPPAACIWMGEGKHAVTYRLSGGTLANFVGVVERDDWQVESWSERGTKEQALADFAGWHPVITRMIEQADAHYRWALFDRVPIGQWSDGRVTLLGDACHPMLPFMAQGAVMAIEDGWVLARTLSDTAHAPDAFTRYEAQRQPRTARVQRRATGNMGIFHRRSAAAKLATYGPIWLASRLMPTALDAQFDWIYGHDVTTQTG